MIRFGILGTARIARALFQSPLEGVCIDGIASRQLEKAHQFGNAFGIPKRYGSYASLLEDPEIDGVYIPLPQHLHRDMVIAAAENGKHVLLEKPCALSVAELSAMEAACSRNGVHYMEALMYRFMRYPNRIKEIVLSGEIGELRYINFNFCFDIVTRGFTGFRLARNEGGGAMYDLGSYGVDFLRFLTETEPELIDARIRRTDGNGIDMFTHAVLRCGTAIASLTGAFDNDANYLTVSGSNGKIYAPVAISGRLLPNELHIHSLTGDTNRIEYFPAEDPYKFEIEYFARCIERKEEPFLGWDNSKANIGLLENIFRSATLL